MRRERLSRVNLNGCEEEGVTGMVYLIRLIRCRKGTCRVPSSCRFIARSNTRLLFARNFRTKGVFGFSNFVVTPSSATIFLFFIYFISERNTNEFDNTIEFRRETERAPSICTYNFASTIIEFNFRIIKDRGRGPRFDI